jgi:hypothetical protein
VIVTAGAAPRFAEIDASVSRIAVGAAVEGWRSFADAHGESGDCTPDGVTQATDTLLLYFASGTTTRPKQVQPVPLGHHRDVRDGRPAGDADQPPPAVSGTTAARCPPLTAEESVP